MFKITDPTAVVKQILDNLKVSQQTGLENHIGAAGNAAVRYGKQVSHKITHHMEKNIQIQTLSQEEVKVVSKAIYSGYENDRGPPHDFFQQMYDYTKTTYGGSVAIGAIQKVQRSKKISGVKVSG